MSIPLGRFAWYELMTTDPDGAAAFYPAVTGWTSEPSAAPGMEDYTEWLNGQAPLGGLMELPEEARQAGAPPHWVAYAATPDIDATLARVEELGGSTLWGIVDVEGVGRVAGFADPHGAVMALWQQEEGGVHAHPDPNVEGFFSWHELASDDWEEGWAFYEALFGWSPAGEFDMGEMGTYWMFSDRDDAPEGQAAGGMFDRGDSIPMAAWILYVRVRDLEAALEAVKAGGGHVANGPMEVPGGDRVAQCVDPQGAVFALHTSH